MIMEENKLTPDFELRTQQIRSYYPSLSSYRELMVDEYRNEFYQNIIQQNCKDKVVLDVGAGVGLLSLMALKSGAKKVYALEVNPEACMVLEQIKTVQNLENLEIINKPSWDFELPEKVDIILHEIFGPFLFDELCLVTLNEVKHHLKDGGKFLPEKFGFDFCILNSQEIKSVKYLKSISSVYDNFIQTGQTILQDLIDESNLSWVTFGPWNFNNHPEPGEIFEEYGYYEGEKDSLWAKPFIMDGEEKMYIYKKNILSHWGNSLLRFGGSITLENRTKMIFKLKINENLSSFDTKIDLA